MSYGLNCEQDQLLLQRIADPFYLLRPPFAFILPLFGEISVAASKVERAPKISLAEKYKIALFSNRREEKSRKWQLKLFRLCIGIFIIFVQVSPSSPKFASSSFPSLPALLFQFGCEAQVYCLNLDAYRERGKGPSKGLLLHRGGISEICKLFACFGKCFLMISFDAQKLIFLFSH